MPTNRVGPTFVIAGAGLAGAKAAQKLRTEGFAGRVGGPVAPDRLADPEVPLETFL